MDAYQISEDKIIKVELSGAAGLLKPVVYIDGKYYCVLLGIDPESGVFGRGRTLEKAIAEWDKQLQAHLKSSDDEDYIVVHIKNILYPPKKKADIQAFYDQFKPGKRK